MQYSNGLYMLVAMCVISNVVICIDVLYYLQCFNHICLDINRMFSHVSCSLLGTGIGHSSPATGSSSSPPTDPCVVRELCAHKQEVCGLKWSFDEKMLASGGNDNKLFIWDSQQGSSSSSSSSSRSTEPLCRFEDHTAAVKAVAWSPHQNGLIASGGGTADRHIRFWNASTGMALHKIDTGSQVQRVFNSYLI
jgi:WD40 repeat protein